MKRLFLFLLLATIFGSPGALRAQTAVTLQLLEVELWPDYDREAVLVLLTGTLPPGTQLPVTLTLPLPDGADFNVAARITPDNVMSDQGMDPEVTPSQVTFTSPESRFRVEYYQPYSVSGSMREFEFTWQADVAVEQLSLTVQQPIAASSLTTTPAPISVSEGQDGLTYHVLPNQGLAPGGAYRVEVAYTMISPQLTVEFSEPSSSELPFLDATPVEDGGDSNWQVWLIALGAVILVASAVWYLASQRPPSRRRPVRPKPQRAAKVRQAGRAAKSQSNFCHECGQPLQPDDKFCRHCGTAVKNS